MVVRLCRLASPQPRSRFDACAKQAQRSTRQVKFTLVESAMFASFDGEWRVQARRGAAAARYKL